MNLVGYEIVRKTALGALAEAAVSIADVKLVNCMITFPQMKSSQQISLSRQRSGCSTAKRRLGWVCRGHDIATCRCHGQ
jgi:hypothetical protein